MAVIEMDVTEFDALRKNITLLEESKKEQKELHKVIDTLKEETLQAFRDSQLKVLTQVTVETVEQAIPHFTSIEFVRFVEEISNFLYNSSKGQLSLENYGGPRRGSHRCNRCGEITGGFNSMCHTCGYEESRSVVSGHREASSIKNWIEHKLRKFIGTSVRTSTTVKQPPVYIGFEEIKRTLQTEITESLDRKTKDLLLLEPSFVAFTMDKAELDNVITSLQEEKIQLVNQLKNAQDTIDRREKSIKDLNRIIGYYQNFMFKLNSILNTSFYLVSSFKAEIKGIRTELSSKESNE